MIEWLRRELWMWFGYRDDYEAAMSRIATGMADVDRLIDDGQTVAAQAAIDQVQADIDYARDVLRRAGAWWVEPTRR